MLIFGICVSSVKAEDPIRIDILVLYTPAVKEFYQGEDGVFAHVLSVIDNSNVILENSAIPMIWNLVGIEEVNYFESSVSLSEDLDNLQKNINGLEEVEDLRTAYGADLVSLFRRGSLNSIAGLAYRLKFGNPQPEFGYSVISDISALSGFTFAHEIGHNLSSAHDRADISITPDVDYSYGHILTGLSEQSYRTIMAATSSYPRIPYFSNPDILFDGVPTGVPIKESNAADNASAFITSGANIENFFSALPAQPEILKQLEGRTVVSGTPLYFESLVKGLPPLEFQWYEGDSGDKTQPISGAVGRLLNLNSFSSTGNFWFSAENLDGDFVSETIRLVSVPRPNGPFNDVGSQTDFDNTGFSLLQSSLWQKMAFQETYVDRIDVWLFKNGNPPDPIVELRDSNKRLVWSGTIDSEVVAGSLTKVSLNVRQFVRPGAFYELSLIPVGGEDPENRILWNGVSKGVDFEAGVGTSSINEIRADGWAFRYQAIGRDAWTFDRWTEGEGIPLRPSTIGEFLDDSQISNLLRYSVGAGATGSPLSLLPQTSDLIEDAGQFFLPYRYFKRRNLVDVAFIVEYSPDLNDWIPVPDDQIELIGSAAGGIDEYEARLPVGANERIFFRVRLLNPPGG